jgi:chromosome condensin MukBEF ATPase and DNA-binding subunit MukB
MKIRNLEQKFRQQSKEEKLIRKVIKIAKQMKAIQQAEELKKAEEARLTEICKRVAKSVCDPMKKVNISKSGDIAEISIQDIVLKNQGTLSMTESIWAPWSQNFKG